ncbi:MAG: hypothetical protein A3F41_04615 [Coxiella sp. RIFCSPHIGHO2_12_FULL_44_14]|nr:MAG: hypothetical protein A3F41_04615 [Coxiella sp. RIFCSPHIGHO2_12_FULL_44_14]
MIPQLKFQSPLSLATQTFLKALAAHAFSGDIEQDPAQRLVMSTDNSVYQILPQAVLFPRQADDIQKIFMLATDVNFKTISFAVRGGGTGTNGQSLCSGIIIDCSRYMNAIKEINLAEQWVVVESGVVLDQLNKYLKKLGYFFPVIISTGNRATLAGMANTNACGKGSTYYGRMSDHVLALSAVLSDGTVLQSRVFSKNEVTTLKQEHSRAAEIIRQIDESVLSNQDAIRALYPELVRTVTGYTLAEVYDAEQQHFNLNAILLGSEGTLAAITELKLKILPLPVYKLLLVVQYADFHAALCDGYEFTELKPTAIEAIDEKILALAKSDILFPVVAPFIINDHAEVGALSLIEFVADSVVGLQKIENQIIQFVKQHPASSRLSYVVTRQVEEMQHLWELRKKSVGLLGRYHIDDKVPISGVEDTLVPPRQLAAFITDFRKILDELKLSYGMFGHVDAGCIHVRPAFDLSNPENEALYFRVITKVEALVRRYGGILWGEHGKGFRSQFSADVFGEKLFAELCKIKKVFDPDNRLNPGKIAVPSGVPGEIVAIDAPSRRGEFNREIDPKWRQHFHIAMLCNGNGACFNFDDHEMICPSYKVTRDRVHSPKGRANLLREWLRLLSLRQPPMTRTSDYSHEVYRAMQGCLGCRSCATECPVQVDISAVKAEFLALYHTRYRRTLRDRLTARSERMAYWQSKIPRFSNFVLGNDVTRFVFKWCLGLEGLPKISYPSMKQLLKKTSFTIKNKPKRVVLLPDWVTVFYDAPVFAASHQLFKKLGFEVVLPDWFENGKTWHVKGYLKQFQKIAEKNTEWLCRFSDGGIPIVGIDPSITLTYRHEYPRYVPQAKQLHVLLPQEFLANQEIVLKNNRSDQPIVLLMHCTEKTSSQLLQEAWIQLFKKFGIHLTIVNTGCCGMAGIYGHEREHRDYSRQLFYMSWMEHLQRDAIVLATGFSCRSQIRRFTQYEVSHPLQFLLDLMPS